MATSGALASTPVAGPGNRGDVRPAGEEERGPRPRPPKRSASTSSSAPSTAPGTNAAAGEGARANASARTPP